MKMKHLYLIVEKKTGTPREGTGECEYDVYSSLREAQEEMRNWKYDMIDKSEIKDYCIQKFVPVPLTPIN